LLTAERRRQILDVLHRNGKVLAAHLAAAMNVSEDTIRRDLRDLAAAGLLCRVHGGALPAAPGSMTFRARENEDRPAKGRIGRAAAGLVRNGQVLFVDGGTTVLEVVRHFPPDLQATVVTNSLPVALALVDHAGVEVVVLGGRFRKSAEVTVGACVVEHLGRVRADMCVLGLCGIHHEAGITLDDYEEAQVKRAMVGGAAEVVGLAAAGKLGTAEPFLVAPIKSLTYLVTDADPASTDPYRAAGVTVLTAK